MKAEKVIHYRLSNYAGVTAIIGSNPARVYPMVVPQTPTVPCISYQLISSDRVEGVYTDPGIVNARIQVTCWAKSYTDVKSLAEQVRLALERYGSWPSGLAVDGVTVYDIKIGSEADTFEPGLELYAQATDYTVTHGE